MERQPIALSDTQSNRRLDSRLLVGKSPPMKAARHLFTLVPAISLGGFLIGCASAPMAQLPDMASLPPHAGLPDPFEMAWSSE